MNYYAQSLREILPYSKEYIKYQFFLFVLEISIVGVNALSPFILSDLIDGLVAYRPINEIIKLIVLLFGLYGAGFLLGLFSEYGFQSLNKRVMLDTWLKIYRRLQLVDIKHIRKYTSADVLSRMSSDCEIFGGIAGGFIPSLIVNFIRLFVLSSVLLLLNVPLALIVIISMLPYYFIFRRYSSILIKTSAEEREEYTKCFEKVKENIEGIITTKIFNAEKFFRERLKQSIDNWFKKIKNVLWTRRLYIAIYSYYSSVVALIILGVGVYLSSLGLVTIGKVIAIFTFVRSVYEPISNISGNFGALAQASPAINRVLELLHLGTIKHNSKEKLNEVREILIENLSFSYDEKNNVLKQINLKLQKGEKIAIVGKSGCGKTTLLWLIAGFYTPKGGRILINGKSLSEYNIKSLRDRIILVPQNVFIFHSTVKDNVLLGYEPSREDILYVIEDCELHRLPGDLDTVVFEQGSNLSGGQKQLIALARAYIRKPSVLLLDEALSELDSDTETRIFKKMVSRFKETIIVIVSHRLSTILQADRIVVLDNGRIVAEGTHEELLVKCPTYKKLVEDQIITSNN